MNTMGLSKRLGSGGGVCVNHAHAYVSSARPRTEVVEI
jgi:hypothetical protein